MKRLLAVALFSIVSAAIVGCEASAKVGDSDDSGTTYKKTVEKTSPDSDTTVQHTTETHTNP